MLKGVLGMDKYILMLRKTEELGRFENQLFLIEKLIQKTSGGGY